MNMEYWIGVVHVVNGISFFGMFFGFGAAGFQCLSQLNRHLRLKKT